MGVAATNSTFTFAYCFMRNETLVDYLWAMRHVKEVFQEYGPQHAVLNFVTNRELALMSALSDTFPNASCLLCRWHINNNILSKQRTAIQTSEAWKEFNQTWNELVAATTMAAFETRLAVMHDRFPAASMSNLVTTWLV